MAHLIFDRLFGIDAFKSYVADGSAVGTDLLSSSNAHFNQKLMFIFRLQLGVFSIYSVEDINDQLLENVEIKISIQPKSSNDQRVLIFENFKIQQRNPQIESAHHRSLKHLSNGKLSFTAQDFLRLEETNLTLHILGFYCENSSTKSQTLKRLERQSEAANALILPSLLQNPKHADVILRFPGGTEFKAHKMILASQSPVFDAMFQERNGGGTFKEAQENQVEISDIEAGVFEHLLKYIYTGKVDLKGDFALKLLGAADKYQVGLLKEYCEEFLCDIFPKLFVDEDEEMEDGAEGLHLIAQVAEMHDARKLKSLALGAIYKKTLKMVQELEHHPDLLLETSRLLFTKSSTLGK